MFDTRDRTWIEASTPVEAEEIEVTFWLKDSFYRGDEKTFHENMHDTVPLPAPPIVGAATHSFTTLELEGHTDILAEHYRRVLELARQYRKPFAHISHHFWMRLWVRAGTDYIPFPWYDTWSEIDRFLRWIACATDDTPYWDGDQGWDFVALRAGSKIHIRHGDDEEEHGNFVYDRDDLIASVSALRARVLAIITALTTKLGEDYWTSHKR